MLTWGGALAFSVLSAALAVAIATRRRSWWARGALIATGTVPQYVVITCGVLLAAMVYDNGVAPCRLSYFVWLLVGYIACSVAVLAYGLGAARGPVARPRASHWPLRRLVAACVAALACTSLFFWRQDSAQLKEYAEISRQNQELAWALLPQIAEDRDATPLYEEAFKSAGNWSSWPHWAASPESWRALDPSRNEVRSFIASKEEALALLRQAARREGCTYRDVKEHPFRYLARDFAPIARESWWLLALDTREKGFQGAIYRVLEDLDAMEGIAVHLGCPPAVHEARAVSLCSSMTCEAYEDALFRLPAFPARERLGRVPSRRLPALLDRVRRFDDAIFFGTLEERATWETALDSIPMHFSEWNVLNRVIDYPMFWPYLGQHLDRVAFVLWRNFWFPSEIAVRARRLDAARALADRSWPEIYRALGGLEVWPPYPQWYLESVWFVECILWHGIRADTGTALLRAGLAATAFRQEKGRYPERLEDLMPEFCAEPPLDPTNGRPLTFTAMEAGLVIGCAIDDLKFRLGAAYEDASRKAMSETPIDYSPTSHRDWNSTPPTRAPRLGDRR